MDTKTNGNGNATVASAYVRLAEAEAAFLVISAQIEGLAGHKSYEGDKDLVAAMTGNAKLLRHQLLGLIGSKLSGYEQRQATKLAKAA